MLQAGKCIYAPNDPLVKVKADYLYFAVKNPKPEIAVAIRQLRAVRNIDIKKYQALKRNLPYVVSAIFYPAIRKTEHFAWANYFIIDIDHLSAKEISPESLKEKLTPDPRVFMMFTSPGEDGLKAVFRLAEKIYDAGKFTLFYKVFLSKFSIQYNLEQVADPRTSDVTRACFISHDPEVFFNPDAQPVNPNEYLDFNNYLEIKQIKSGLKETEKEQTRLLNEIQSKQEIGIDALDKIKATLNPNFKPKREKQIFVPEEVDQVISNIQLKMQNHQIVTSDIININYGKKLRFNLGARQAEINLFYGKKGFSVVISPRNGTDTELNQVCWQLLREWLV